MANPIWKDYYFTLSGTTAEYRIRVGSTSGKIIYQGKAVARPGESSCRIRVNEICADYIRQSLPVIGESFTPADYSLTFFLQWNSPSGWVPYSVTFLYDWSYDYGYDATRDGLSFPISKVVDSRQLLVISTTSASVTAVITHLNGTTETVTIYTHTPGDFNDDYNNDYYIFDQAATPGTAVLDLGDYQNVRSVAVAGLTFIVDNTLCHQYVAYYVNAYGGWDSLLMRGRCYREEAYTRHTAKAEYNNANATGRGTVNYANEVEDRLLLRTGWLDDTGGDRMRHLVGSTMVYVLDLLTGEMLPVTISDTECRRKSYMENGAKFFQYEITAVVAQERARR